jgi:hypothetical protein
VALGGISVGASLALDLAARVKDVAAVFAVCPPFRLHDFSTRFMPKVEVWERLLQRMKGGEPERFLPFSSDNPLINYGRNPVSGIREVGRLLAGLEEKVADILQPALIIQADGDPVIDAQGSLLFRSSAAVARVSSMQNGTSSCGRRARYTEFSVSGNNLISWPVGGCRAPPRQSRITKLQGETLLAGSAEIFPHQDSIFLGHCSVSPLPVGGGGHLRLYRDLAAGGVRVLSKHVDVLPWLLKMAKLLRCSAADISYVNNTAEALCLVANGYPSFPVTRCQLCPNIRAIVALVLQPQRSS